MTEGENEETRHEDDRRQTSSRLWTPGGDSRAGSREKPAGGSTGPGVAPPPAGEMSEEEMRRRIEEAMEKITVADVVVDMVVSLASLAYQRMGIPREVNEKFRDMDQAKLAIDCLDAMLGVLEGTLESERFEPLRGTVDNLKLNYAKEK